MFRSISAKVLEPDQFGGRRSVKVAPPFSLERKAAGGRIRRAARRCCAWGLPRRPSTVSPHLSGSSLRPGIRGLLPYRCWRRWCRWPGHPWRGPVRKPVQERRMRPVPTPRARGRNTTRQTRCPPATPCPYLPQIGVRGRKRARAACPARRDSRTCRATGSAKSPRLSTPIVRSRDRE